MADLRGYTVVDAQGRTVGPVTGFWMERGTQRPAFASVRTGVLRGRDHVVPLRHARLEEERRRIQVPYALDRIREAPSHDVRELLHPDLAASVEAHYARPAAGEHLGDASRLPGDLPLHAERAEVSTRVVQAGAVRLRKVVRTRIVQQPVEVRYEEIVVERIPPGELPPGAAVGGSLPAEPFAEGEVVLRELAEEPVVTTFTEVVGGVRPALREETERTEVHATVRHEDVEVERS
ncbi:MAG TPA: PRC and DUF2382 domain-containing protein [Candidatus Thermoplasmatota archaeon]|nr:PRC and DUF2382 domain-containing protein [Candidatus Thermoplasmatota archaeon]